MEPFSAAIGAIQLLEGCLRAYHLIIDGTRIGTDGYRLISDLRWQQYRLSQWAVQSGLTSKHPPEQLNWACAIATLLEQEQLLTSADRLKVKYNLHVSEEEVAQFATAEAEPLDEFGGLLRSLRPEFSSQIIKRKNGPIKRLLWAGVGRNELARVVDDLRKLNDRLDHLLDSADRELNRRIRDELLRDIISRCQDLGGIESVQIILSNEDPRSQGFLSAVAALRRALLIIGPTQPRSQKPQTAPESEAPTLRQLHYSRLQPQSASFPLSRRGVEIVQYGRDSVVVEWRVVDQTRWKQVERAMQRLAFLLSAMGKATFHTLPCLGLVASQAAGHIGLVYQITSPSPNSTCTWHHTSLFTILGQSHTISLSRRVALAIEMAETLFQVHTAGWLHKGLRSENIIFLSTSTEIGSSIVFSQGYLVGFEYSRPDSSAAVCLTEPPRDPLSTDLYRHPAARGLSRETYSKRFDLYSLGCLLLELALWRQVGEIALMSHQPDLALDVHSGIPPTRGAHSPSFLDFESFTVLQDLVRYHAGDSFCNAIALCFTASQDDTGATTKAHGKILETLRSCRQGH